jgi:hypothetical protein
MLEWEPGSDLLGDFIWPGGVGSDVAISERAAVSLGSKFWGFHLGEVQTVDVPAGFRAGLRGLNLSELLVDVWPPLISFPAAVRRPHPEHCRDVSSFPATAADESRGLTGTPVRSRMARMAEGRAIP